MSSCRLFLTLHWMSWTSRLTFWLKIKGGVSYKIELLIQPFSSRVSYRPRANSNSNIGRYQCLLMNQLNFMISKEHLKKLWAYRNLHNKASKSPNNQPSKASKSSNNQRRKFFTNLYKLLYRNQKYKVRETIKMINQQNQRRISLIKEFLISHR